MQFLDRDRRIRKNSLILLLVSVATGVVGLLYAGYSILCRYILMSEIYYFIGKIVLMGVICGVCAYFHVRLKQKYAYQKAMYENTIYQMVQMGQLTPQLAMQCLYAETQKSFESGKKTQKVGTIILGISAAVFLVALVVFIALFEVLDSGWEMLAYYFMIIIAFAGVAYVSVNGFFAGLFILIYGTMCKKETFQMPGQ